jgi:WD40 repeat protein
VIKIWDLPTGEESATLKEEGAVLGLQWGTGGRQIAAVIKPDRVRIWDVARRERVFAADAGGLQVEVPLVSADGQRVAAESTYGITIWQTATARPIFRMGMRPGRCDPQARRWAVVDTLPTAAALCRVVDTDTGETLLQVRVPIPSHQDRYPVAWSPDGRRLAAGFRQGGVHIYAVPADPSQVRTFNAGAARAFEWSPDGKRFAISTGDGIRIGRLPLSDPPIRLGPPQAQTPPVVFSLSPDGRFLAGADGDGSVSIWEVASGRLARRIPGHPAPVEMPHIPTFPTLSALLWSPDGKWLAGFRSGDGLWVWEVATGRLLTSFAFGSSFQTGSSPPIVWSRDSQFLAVLTSPTVRVLDVTAGKQVREWAADTSFSNWANLIAWGPTEERLTTGIGNPPWVRIWDVKTGEKVFSFEEPTPDLDAMSWSPDGRRLVKLLHEKCEIYDRDTRRSVSLPRTGTLLAWKPDGSQLAFYDQGVELYEAATGTPIAGARGYGSPDAAAMRARTGGSGAQVVKVQSFVWGEHGFLAAGEGVIPLGGVITVVWDVGTGKPLLTLRQGGDTQEEGTGDPRMIAWAPDSQSLATVVQSGVAGTAIAGSRIDIWDVATGRKKQTVSGGELRTHGAAAVAWSPDGHRLASASEPTQVVNLALPSSPRILRRWTGSPYHPPQPFLDWAADSRSLAVLEWRREAHKSELTVWDLGTGNERFNLARAYDGNELHAPLALSPDGKRVALGGSQSGVWNVESAKQEFALAAPESIVVEVGWAPNGRRVFSRAEVCDPFVKRFELRVWDAATGREVCVVRGPMAGWLVAPGFHGFASQPDLNTPPDDVIVWDLTVSNK